MTGTIIASIIERAGHAAVRRVGDSTEVRLTRADFRVSIDAVCREAGARDTDVENRRHVQDIGRGYFDDVLDLGELPELLREELDQEVHGERQTKITDHDFGT